MDAKVDIITGIRATGDLTVANYLGAVQPIVEILQQPGAKCMVFVADLHALTDHEPKVVRKYTREVVADYLALGLDPQKVTIYIQSRIAFQINTLTNLLARLITVAELLRVPTLKDKLKGNAGPETANALLLLYPVIMAADILLQRAREVPVGEDQLAHLEVVRELARRFNKKYGGIFPLPKAYQVKPLRILSLRGSTKMSKSFPEDAIFLTDSPEVATRKIKRAQTATEGIMTESLESHILLVKGLCSNESDRLRVDELVRMHMQGVPVMNDFKELMARVAGSFLSAFQNKKAEIMRTPDYIDGILETGARVALTNADETLGMVYKAMFGEI